MIPSFRIPSWFVAIIFLFSITALQIHAINTTYMHPDEELSYHTAAGHDLPYVVRYESQHDVHPLLWYSLFWGWLQVAGESEFAGRLHAILLSMLTLALVYQIGRRWFGKPRYGLFAMAALGVNAYFFIYSLDIRPYALVSLVVTFSMLMFQRWLVLPTRRHAILYGLSAVLMLYTHYYTAFVIFGQVFLFLLRRPSRPLLRQALVAGGIIVLLWLPWFPIFLNQMLTIHQLTAGTSSSVFALGAPTETTRQGITNLTNVSTNGLIVVYIPLLVVGCVGMLRQRDYWIGMVWAIFAPAVVFAINLALPIYTTRYISYIAVGLAIVLGAALANLPTKLRVVALLGFTALSLWALPAQLPVRPPYRTIFRQVSAAAQPGDVLFFDKANETESFLHWNYQLYVSPTLRGAAVYDLPNALSSRRIWFVTTDPVDAQVHATFKEIEHTHPLQNVIGSCGAAWCYLFQLMEAPPLQQPVVFGDDLPFWGADIDTVTSNAITTRLWWKTAHVPHEDYSIGLYLLNAGGALVAQSDGPIDNFGTDVVPTSQLKPDTIYVDYRTLALSAPLPEGDYRLMLAVYRWTDQVRLKLSDGSDLLPLKTLRYPL